MLAREQRGFEEQESGDAISISNISKDRGCAANGPQRGKKEVRHPHRAQCHALWYSGNSDGEGRYVSVDRRRPRVGLVALRSGMSSFRRKRTEKEEQRNGVASWQAGRIALGWAQFGGRHHCSSGRRAATSSNNGTWVCPVGGGAARRHRQLALASLLLQHQLWQHVGAALAAVVAAPAPVDLEAGLAGVVAGLRGQRMERARVGTGGSIAEHAGLAAGACVPASGSKGHRAPLGRASADREGCSSSQLCG